jgi:type IV pilus assembly protein PilF
MTGQSSAQVLLARFRSGRGGPSLRAAAAAVISCVLAGCATGPADGPREDLKTSSDQTDADKRARVRLELAAGYFSRGQATTALDEVKLALAARPDLPEAFNLRGLIYAALGEPRLAEDSFKRALQLAPRDADAMHNFGWFLCQSGRFAESDGLFRQALAQPQYRDTVRTLMAQGVCQARAQRWSDAEATLTRAYELDPGNPVSGFHLSDLLFRRGEFERARFYIRRVHLRREFASPQSLWLGARLERRLGDSTAMRALGQQLQERFPQSPETLMYEKGRFDD